MYKCHQAAVTKYHKLKWLKINLFPHSSGGHKSEIKVSTEPCSHEGSGGGARSLPSTLPNLWWLLTILSKLQLLEASLQSLLLFSCNLLCVCVCVFIVIFILCANFCFLIRIPVIGLCPPLIQYDLI